MRQKQVNGPDSHLNLKNYARDSLAHIPFCCVIKEVNIKTVPSRICIIKIKITSINENVKKFLLTYIGCEDEKW
jgi:hypothetical protein